MPNFYTPRFQDYMKSNDHISLILSDKDGFKLFTFYECLLCQSIPGKGIVELPNNKMIITPYLLGVLLNRFTDDPEFIDHAIKFLEKNKIIEIMNDGRTIRLVHYIQGRPDVHGVEKELENVTPEEHHELTLYLLDIKFFSPKMKSLRDADVFFESQLPVDGFTMSDLKELLGKMATNAKKKKDPINNRVAYMKRSFMKSIQDIRDKAKKEAYKNTLSSYEEAGF